MNTEELDLKIQQLTFDSKKRVRLYENLAGMLKDGLPLDACLRQIHERMVVRKNPMKIMIATWMQDLVSGKSFADALVGWAPAQELVLISASERSQSLPEGLARAIRINQDAQTMKKTVSNALISPSFLIIALLGMIYGFSTSIVPVFAKVLAPEKWVGSSQTLYQVSQFVTSYWFTSIVILSAIVAVVVRSLPTWCGDFRKYANYIPPYSLYRVYSSATFIMAVSSLMDSGIPIDGALKYVKKNASTWIKHHISIMQRRLNAGMSYGNALDTGLLTDDMIDQILIYEGITDFNKAMMSIGDKAIKNSVEKMDSFASTAKNVMTLVVGLTLGWMYFASYQVNVQVASEATKMSSKR